MLVVIAVIAVLIGILLPALGKARASARNAMSRANMRSLGQSGVNYSNDFKGSIFSYTWKRGESYKLIGRPTPVKAQSVIHGAGLQNTDILRRLTGRISTPTINGVSGTGNIKSWDFRIPQRRFSHCVLFDYLTSAQPEPIAASPFDRNLLRWQKNPFDLSIVPYAISTNIEDLLYVDVGQGWKHAAMRQRWPYAATYQVVPAAWSPDNLPTVYPFEGTPHLMDFIDPRRVPINLGKRRFPEVAFPSGKVHMFEEFDRFTDSAGIAWMYPEAKCNLLFFDGSVRGELSRDSNPGWNPKTPPRVWKQRWVSLDTFPLLYRGSEFDEWFQYYRFTREGLAGLDYGGSDVNLLDWTRDHPDYPKP